jgi:hypothetical protein
MLNVARREDEADKRENRTQAHIASAATALEPENPGTCAASADLQVKASPICVQSGRVQALYLQGI